MVALISVLVLSACAGSSGPQAEEPRNEPAPVQEAAPPPVQPRAPVPPPKPPALSIHPQRILQGDLAEVTVSHLPPGTDVTIQVESFPEPVKTYEFRGAVRGFIGVPTWSGVTTFAVSAKWEGGSLHGQVEVVGKKFTEDWLWVTPQVEQIRFDPRAAEDTRKVVRARSESSPAPLWRGPFQAPLQGPITTHFGEIRFVNGKEAGRHSGTDFGAPEGTPVRAPARGTVTLAEDLVVTGGTIYIDHGVNLFTGYLHLSKILVEVGDEVQPGQVIGHVGSTGFSTGPHLHWMATIGNVAVNPFLLVEASPFLVEAPDWSLVEE